MTNASTPALAGGFATNPLSPLRTVAHRLGLLVNDFFAALSAKRLYEEYDRLSDIELAELGIKREDLTHRVAEAVGLLSHTD